MRKRAQKYTRYSSKSNLETRVENWELTPADKCLKTTAFAHPAAASGIHPLQTGLHQPWSSIFKEKEPKWTTQKFNFYTTTCCNGAARPFLAIEIAVKWIQSGSFWNKMNEYLPDLGGVYSRLAWAKTTNWTFHNNKRILINRNQTIGGVTGANMLTAARKESVRFLNLWNIPFVGRFAFFF